MLQRRDFGELVSMMECDSRCSMEIHYELCESQLWKGIGEEISGEQKDEQKKKKKGWMKEEGRLYSEKMKLNLQIFMIINKCGADFGL